VALQIGIQVQDSKSKRQALVFQLRVDFLRGAILNLSVVAVRPIASRMIARHRSLLIFAVCVLVAIATHAQHRASIQGVVADFSCAVIPGVTATLTDHPTKQVLKSTTSVSGLYSFNALPSNNFSITFETEEFKKTFDNIYIFSEQSMPGFMQMDGTRPELQSADKEAKFPEAAL
jgi:hypothetical protein